MLTAYTVTYYLSPEQEAALCELAEPGQSIKDVFDTMMTAGSNWDIRMRIKALKVLAENKRGNNAVTLADVSQFVEDEK